MERDEEEAKEELRKKREEKCSREGVTIGGH